MKTAIALVILASACATVHPVPGGGGAIKTWTPGERITTVDLNADLNHIHTNMVGGHGARLVDADVSASANIASSKLAAYRYIPRLWGGVTTRCTGTPCTVSSSAGVSSVTRAGTGSYRIVPLTPLTDLNFSIMITGNDGAAGRLAYYVSAGSTTSSLIVICDSDFAGTKDDCSFSFVLFDDN